MAQVIYTGLPPREPLPHRSGIAEIVVGTAGRLVELKGIEYLIRAVAALRNDFPALRLEIAGSGPHRVRLEEEVARADLAGRVKFLGWIGDIGSVLSRWDVFVLPSLEEGFPVAALDAMAAGLPVVATAVGGVPELIEDEKSGWLVPPRDVEALTARLRLLLVNLELRQSVGAAAFARVRDHFNAAQMANAFGRLYDELLSEFEG
jgi:glycosyltransferase involved in cell wall biosynthesis